MIGRYDFFFLFRERGPVEKQKIIGDKDNWHIDASALFFSTDFYTLVN